MYITPIITAKYTITKAIKISVPISVLKLPDNTNSSKAVTNIDGSVDIIPAIIISDTPFPIPFWVIWSPSHNRNAVPAVITVATYM